MSIRSKNLDFGRHTNTLAIDVAGVSKRFGLHPVLTAITLQMPAGKRFVVCGPSGSGKSTLVRCIVGLERRSAGSIRVAGHDLDLDCANARQLAGDVGMVFQQFNLFPHLTVMENLILAPRRVRKMTRAAAEEIAMSQLRKVRVDQLKDKYPSQLSGGQQQRVAIARALTMEPAVMLFDEPTSALDPELVNEVLDVMLGLADEGMSMMVVTHEMRFARQIADQIVFMDKGEIVEVTPPDCFFTTSQNTRVRSFVEATTRG
ncbi:MAG: amino acid ABC transporter ATP-binding protein [Mesorhizobium sp.]|nr:MAG: amino acid ABC transporter ATP-binding protein [Mesorhizobium sp.]